MRLIYLASPYSHKDPKVSVERFSATCLAAAHLFNCGFHVFSPIAHCHPIKVLADIDGSWGFWKNYALNMLQRCDELYVLKLDGWTDSIGVATEAKIASELGKPISYMDGETYEIKPLLPV